MKGKNCCQRKIGRRVEDYFESSFTLDSSRKWKRKNLSLQANRFSCRLTAWRYRHTHWAVVVFCFVLFFCVFFSVRPLSVLRGHSVFSSPPQRPMTSEFEGFSIPDFIHYIYFSYLNSWERAEYFPLKCSVLIKGTTGTIFITSLVWRGPWLGIEPGTSRTRSQHSTNRLSRRRYCFSMN